MTKFGRDVETKWGIYIDESLDQRVKFTVLATGFGIKDVPGMENVINKRTIEEIKKQEEEEEKEEIKDIRRSQYYGSDITNSGNKRARYNTYIFDMDDLTNDDIISMVEDSPTYQRTRATLTNIESTKTKSEVDSNVPQDFPEGENTDQTTIVF